MQVAVVTSPGIAQPLSDSNEAAAATAIPAVANRRTGIP
jgi:hypothetical protein